MNKFVKTALAFSLAASVAVAGEFPIGDPVELNGMEIAALSRTDRHGAKGHRPSSE